MRLFEIWLVLQAAVGQLAVLTCMWQINPASVIPKASPFENLKWNPAGVISKNSLNETESQVRQSDSSEHSAVHKPSSACFSHSTNGFSCSRRTPFPLPSLYHFKIASSLNTSAADKNKIPSDYEVDWLVLTTLLAHIGKSCHVCPANLSYNLPTLDRLLNQDSNPGPSAVQGSTVII